MDERLPEQCQTLYGKQTDELQLLISQQVQLLISQQVHPITSNREARAACHKLYELPLFHGLQSTQDFK